MTRHPARSVPTIVLLLAALVAVPIVTTATGCRNPLSRFNRGGPAQIVSLESPVRLTPNLPTRHFRQDTEASADIILTDLPEDVLNGTAPFAGATGHLVHIHLFVRPRPGRTPIEETAITAVVRHAILVEGEVGIYTGAGFLSTAWAPGDTTFGGVLEQASMRMNARTTRFADRLGPSELSVGFSAPGDESRTDDAMQTLEELISRATIQVEHISADPIEPLPEG